jgi:hypothetical protein
VTAQKSRSFERPVLLRKHPVVFWVTMTSHRPKLPLEIRPGSDCIGVVTGHRPGNPIERRLSDSPSGRCRPCIGVIRTTSPERLLSRQSGLSLCKSKTIIKLK